MLCFFSGSKPVPVETTFIKSSPRIWSKSTWSWLKTFVRYCHLNFLCDALPLSDLIFYFFNLPLRRRKIVISNTDYSLLITHYSLLIIHYSPILSSISFFISAINSSTSFAPKSPFPCRRTDAFPSLISFSPITNI